MLLLHIYYKLINLLSHVLYTIPIFHFGNNMKLSALGFPRRGSQKNKRPQFFFEVKIAGKVYDRQGSWGALAVHPSPLPFFFWFWQPPKRRPTERLGAKSWKNKKSTRKLRSYCRLYIYIFLWPNLLHPPRKKRVSFFFNLMKKRRFFYGLWRRRWDLIWGPWGVFFDLFGSLFAAVEFVWNHCFWSKKNIVACFLKLWSFHDFSCGNWAILLFFSYFLMWLCHLLVGKKGRTWTNGGKKTVVVIFPRKAKSAPPPHKK